MATPTMWEQILRAGSTECVLVGWGSGKTFQAVYPLAPLPLAYTVEYVDRAKIGQTVAGVPVRGVDALSELDPRLSFVVVYSNYFNECRRQVGSLCDVPAIPAFDPSTIGRVRTLLEVSACDRPQPRQGDSPHAIVIQGPLVAGTSEAVIRSYRAQFPDADIVLSTWRDSPPVLVEQMSGYVDEVVLSDAPAHGGVQNRNLQLVSTRRGVEAAMARGAQRILKTRTDMALLSPNLLARLDGLLEQADPGPARRYGLRNRLVVPQTFTRAYLPYHCSDLMMYGEAEDLLRFWSAPHDSRQFTITPPITATIGEAARSMMFAESWLSCHFCRTIDRPLDFTLTEWWRLLGELMIVVDDSWCGLLWAKQAITGVASHLNWRLVGHDHWRAMANGEVPAGFDPDFAIDSLRICDL